MPKKVESSTTKEALVRRRRSKIWTMPVVLVDKLAAHPLWPNLKAQHWQPVVMAALDLDRKLPISDPRYNVIRKHC